MDKEKKLQQCNGVKNNNEVTLRIRGNIDEFKKVLKEKGYVETEHFILYDTFMIPESLEIEKLIEKLKMEELPLDFEDCFVKKAEVELNKLYKELEKGINSLEKVEKISEEEVYEELDKI